MYIDELLMSKEFSHLKQAQEPLYDRYQAIPSHELGFARSRRHVCLSFGLTCLPSQSIDISKA